MLLTKLDWLGKIAWLATTAVAFAVAWPFGFAILAYPAGSGRLHPWLAEYADAPGTWFNFLVASQSPGRPQLSGSSATRGRTLQGL